MMSLICEQNQLPESSENSKTTLEKGGRSPPDVKLDFVLEDLLKYFNKLEILCKTKKEIEKKYGIVKEQDDCWSEDDIRRAWGKTQRIDYYLRRNRWALVIVLQILKRQRTKEEESDLNEGRHLVQRCAELSLIDTPDQMKAERENGRGEDVIWSTVDINQACGKAESMKVISEERSTQSSDELKTLGAAGGDEQMSGAGKKVSKVSSLSEDSGVASGSQLSAFSTDVAPSPTEVNPIVNSRNSKTKKAALMNKDTLVNNCEQQTYVDNYDQCLADVHDKENARWKNGLRSACGISQRMKENSGEGSTQSNAEPQQTEQTKETAGQQPGADSGASKRKYKDNTGPEDSGERDDSNDYPKRCSLKRNDDGSWTREKPNSQTVYIRIPFSVMSGNESPSITETEVQNKNPTYKLIDRVPYLTEIRKRKSYALLYNNQTKNAAWVYEILNSETLKEAGERKDVFSVDQSIHPFYQASSEKYTDPYVRGHLAAAANHMWCQKALDDTFLMSNITPQHKDLNNGKWKQLEAKCRSKTKENDIRNVHVYSGPLYLPRDRVVKYKEMRGQAVPTHFFKVIIVEHYDGTAELECYKMPKEKLEDKPKERVELEGYKMPKKKLEDNLDDYKEPIEEIEKASGLIFREKSCSKGETDSDREITWTGENEHGETCTVKTQVRISTPCS